MKNSFKKCYIMTNFADLTAISQKRGCIKLKFFKFNLIQPILINVNFIHVYISKYFILK
ncbi:hypothetical protein [Clostridium butyricum]